MKKRGNQEMLNNILQNQLARGQPAQIQPIPMQPMFRPRPLALTVETVADMGAEVINKSI